MYFVSVDLQVEISVYYRYMSDRYATYNSESKECQLLPFSMDSLEISSIPSLVTCEINIKRSRADHLISNIRFSLFIRLTISSDSCDAARAIYPKRSSQFPRYQSGNIPKR